SLGVVDQVRRVVGSVVARGGGDRRTVGGGGQVLLERHRPCGGRSRGDGDPGQGARPPARCLQGHVVGAWHHVDRGAAAAPGGHGRRGDPCLVVADVEI